MSDKLKNLQIVYQLLKGSEVLSEMPEIERALRIIYGARYVRKYDESVILQEVVDWLSKCNLSVFEEFQEEEYEELHGSDHAELMDLTVKIDETLLREMANLLHFPMNIEDASQEALGDYLAHELVKDRDYDYYSDLIELTYRDLLIEAFSIYKDKVYESQRLQILCYEEGFSSELYLFTGEALIEYCGDDLEKLAMIYFEEYGEVYYKGTIEELPDEIQLFIKLR